MGVPLTRLACATRPRGNHARNCPVATNPYCGKGAEIPRMADHSADARHGQTQRNQTSVGGRRQCRPQARRPR